VSLASGKRAKPVRAQPANAERKDLDRAKFPGDLISMFMAPRLLAAGTCGETAHRRTRLCRAQATTCVKIVLIANVARCRPFENGRAIVSRPNRSIYPDRLAILSPMLDAPNSLLHHEF
jgi:hypothetical protein